MLGNFCKNDKIIWKIYMASSRADEGNFTVLPLYNMHLCVINYNSYYQLYIFKCISVLFIWWTGDVQMNLPAMWGPLERKPFNPDVNTHHPSYSFDMQSDTDVPALYQGGYLLSLIFFLSHSVLICGNTRRYITDLYILIDHIFKFGN